MMISWYTEKGNVSVKVRSQVKAQVVEMLKTRIGNDLIETPRGLAIEVAQTQTGEPIYAILDATISTSTEVKEKAPKSKASTEVVVPKIFG